MMKRKVYESLSSAKQELLAFVLTVFFCTAYSQTTYTFNYTGSTQTISLPPGNYSIQCWGADGGNATNGTNPMSGGKGGYSRGVYTNSATAVFNVYVGGHGGNASGASNLGGGGGGMSDIAPASNTTQVIIAAGGGGGATSGSSSSESSTGGGGGGLVGGTAQDNTGVSSGTAASGGSQTAGGIAQAGSYGAGSPGGYGYGGGAANGGTAGVMHSAGGAGGNGGNGGWNGGGGGCTSTGGNDHSAGGGAGYYGGGGGRGDGGAGGGGSSYIGGVSSATTIMFGQGGFVANPNSAGHGHVLITELCFIDVTAAGASNSVSPIICSGQSLTLTTNAISNYSWSTGATTSSLVVSPTTNTVYTLTATSPSNCTASKSISVTVSSGLPVLTISNPSNNICLGSTATLTASGAISYTWTGNVTNGQTFTPTATSGYTVTGANGCGTVNAVTGITVAPLQVTVLANPTIVCEGLPTVLSASSAVNGYTWSQGGNTPTLLAAPLTATVYTVTASDGTCSGTGTVAVSTKPNPTLAISLSSATLCEGKSATITVTGADTYTWIPSTITGSTAVVSPTTSSLYQVSGTNSVNCTTGTSTVILVTAAPVVSSNLSSTLTCSGNPVLLSASGGTSVVWSSGPTTNTISVSPTVNTVYTFTAYGNGGCDASKSITVNVVTPVLGVTPSTAICKGAAITLSAGPGSNFNWLPSGGGFPSISISPTVTTTYTVSAMVSSLGINCPATNTTMVTVNPNPTVTATAGSTVICKGNSLQITASGASTYSWAQGTTATITFTSNLTTVQTVTVLGTDGNGCSSLGSIQIKVNACTAINESQGNAGISIWPNPNNGEFRISAQTEVHLKLINELGQEIKHLHLNPENGHSISLNEVAAGIYFIVGQDKDSTFSQKVIVGR